MPLESIDIEVQSYGCIALPEELSIALRSGPGSGLQVVADPLHRAITVQAVNEETHNVAPSATRFSA